MVGLVALFLKEEIRLRRSFSSAFTLLLFPQLIFLGALSGYLFSPLIDDSLTYDQIHTAVMLGLFLFGISMGGIAFLGKEFIERSLGPVTMLAASSEYQPVNSKRMYLSYFLHDLLFYTFLVLVPLTSALAVGQIARTLPLERFLLISSAHWCSFLIGISFSLMISSALTNRDRRMLMIIPLGFVPPMVVQLASGELTAFLVPLAGILQGNWDFLLISLSISLLYIVLGVLFFDGGPVKSSLSPSGSYSHVYASLGWLSDPVLRGLLSREFINLVRGKAYLRMLFSLGMPMLVILALAGLIGGIEGSPIQFNMVFFSVMLSFFTVSIYANLVNMDYLDFDQTMPVSTTEYIGIKVVAHSLLALPISVSMLLVIAIAVGDLTGLLLGIPVVIVAVPYMGYVTAYLTGLWTNSLLFDSSVFVRYLIFTVLPLMSATMLSYLMDHFLLASIIGLGVVVLAELITVLYLRRGIEKKWMWASLSSVP